jgi:ABC-type cobalt transport system substrate-binding protein
MKTKRLLFILSGAAVLLLLPLLAMQFTTEVQWSGADFVIMGILLLSTGLLIELVLRKIKTTKNRLLLGGMVIALFLLIWAELAVGVFGSPFAGS